MKYLAIAIGFMSVSCIDNNKAVNKINYWKDQRTGLCFAAFGMGTQSGLLTNVPCTPEVGRLIKGGDR